MAATPRKRVTDDRRTALHRAANELSELAPRLYRLLRTALDADDRCPSLEQLRVMHRIDHGYDTVSALATVRQMRMSAITAFVDALVARRWVTRRADEHDRRRTRLALTASGRAALQRGRQRATRQMSVILDHYDGSAETLLAVTEALDKAVSAHDDLVLE